MKRKQVLALLIAAAITASMAAPAYAAVTMPANGIIYQNSEEAGEITESDLAAALSAMAKDSSGTEVQGAEKEETVYVFTDANGNLKSMTVSNWLKNRDGSSELYDRSILKNIENVKGDESFTQNGEELVWNAGGNDIYYQGTTDKQPPVTQKITYFLEGTEVTPEELAGKTGKVKIRIEYENTESYKDVYVPFTTMTGIIFSNDNVKNVEVDNGSVISEGKNTVVVGMAFPGLSDSLQVVKDDADHLLEETEAGEDSRQKLQDLNIPDSVEITLDAVDFKMSTCMTMVFSGLLDDEEDDSESLLKDMDEKIADLEKDGNDLADGAGELSDGIEEAASGSSELSDGAGELADGISEYTDGVSKVNDGASQINDGAGKLVKSLPSLTKGLKEYTGGVAKINSGAGDLKDGISQYTGGVSQLNEGAGKLREGTKQLTDSLPDLESGIKNYTDGVQSVDDGLGQLVENLPDFTSGTSLLSGGLEQFGTAVNDLSSGLVMLHDGTQQLADSSEGINSGVKQLADGAKSLSEGLTQYTGGVAEAKKGTAAMLDQEKGIPALETGASSLAGAVRSYTASVKTAAETVKSGADAITGGLSDAKNSLGDLDSAEEKIGNLQESADRVSGGIPSSKQDIDDSIDDLEGIADMGDMTTDSSLIESASKAGLEAAGSIESEHFTVDLDVYNAVYNGYDVARREGFGSI